MSKTPEGALQRLVMDYLAAEHIFSLRMNTGTAKIDNRFVSFGLPGMADILAFPRGRMWVTKSQQEILWIELKAPKGKQSPLQKSFQEKVESEGHRYVLAYSLDDVRAALA